MPELTIDRGFVYLVDMGTDTQRVFMCANIVEGNPLTPFAMYTAATVAVEPGVKLRRRGNRAWSEQMLQVSHHAADQVVRIEPIRGLDGGVPEAGARLDELLAGERM